MSNFTDLLASPEVQAVLTALAKAAEPETQPQEPTDLAAALALIERDKTAASIRIALDVLSKAPANLDRAEWLERQAQKNPSALSLDSSFQDQDQEQYAHVMAFKSIVTQEKRGGKRKGAGRKPSAEGAEKATGKFITLYPAEWERIDALASNMGTTRSGVIRAALDALEARQSA